MNRLAEEMRPRQILDVARGSGAAFIPVSPRYEWHSYHLPMGVDGIIAESVAARLAEACQGVFFRTLSFGLDEVRSRDFKLQVGLDPEADVFGMNFPTVPLASEYCAQDVLREGVAGRLDAVRRSGFRYAFVINHHGGVGQVPTLEALAEAHSRPAFRVEVLLPARFSTFKPPAEHANDFRVGGHAGLCETLQLLAFRPDLVDLDELPEGALSAAGYGILHSQPTIPGEYNPRRASATLAQQWGENVMANLLARVRARLAGEGPAIRMMAPNGSNRSAGS
jgi:creatinine amidohydrolase/Fe(II)-dependent formamide hydrolase-like protein